MHKRVPGLGLRSRYCAVTGLRSQVFYVSVRAEARIVGEVPAGVVGVVVDYNLIAGPIPIGYDGVVVRENAPVEIVEPEALAISSLKVEDVFGTEACGKAAMRPGVIQVEAGIVAAAVVADPLIVLNVHMG